MRVFFINGKVVTVNDGGTKVVVKSTAGECRWLGIDSTYLISQAAGVGFSSDEPGFRIVDALDGGGQYWQATATVPHWFILDLGAQYEINYIRTRSNASVAKNPTDVDLFVSDESDLDNPSIFDWELAEFWDDGEFANKPNWEVLVLPAQTTGRYIKLSINATEAGNNMLYGTAVIGERIFDVCATAMSGSSSSQSSSSSS